MVDNSINNKRIAKNTMLLYGRMLFLMLISLYTSRVILNALGVEDYGIYNVVGGVVAMFSVMSSSLSAAISRFITFELGKEDLEKLKKVFITSINVQFFLILIITILLETVGLWFLNYKMVIPSERIVAANWIFQFSVITFAINLWSIPYNASIIAHERMSAFAYITIFDALAKLGIAFLILKNPFDRLVYYGSLLLIVGILQRFMYSAYCKKHFEECKYKIVFYKDITKELFGFAGWNFIGASSAILRDQGGNVIVNLFFGPAVNAARGVSMSVNSAVTGFVTNFMTALNPQITKNYAKGDFDYMFKLAFQGARLSFYILLLFALPIMFTAPYLLKLWLGIVPDHASSFTVLVLIFALSETLAGPLVTVMLATGNIRNYQIIVGGCQLLNLPLSYLFLRFGYPPESIFIIAIFVSVICEITRLIMLRSMVGLSIRTFMSKVYFNVIIVTIVSSIVPFVVTHYMIVYDLFTFLLMVCITALCAACAIYFVGCSKKDRQLINSGIKNILSRIR